MSEEVPSDDYPGMLNRTQALVTMKAKLGVAFDLLFEELRWGLGLFERCCNYPNDERTLRVNDTARRLFWLYLETLDACDILIGASAVAPARAQVRSLLEIALQLLFVVQKNDDRIAAGYTAARRRRSMRIDEMLATGSKGRQEIIAEAERTRNAPKELVDLIRNLPDTQQEADRIRASLQGALWKDAFDELERVAKQTGRDPQWYAVFGGPTNVRKLAKEVKMELWYRLMYSTWSETIHGGTPERPFIPQADGTINILWLRDTTGWQALVESCHNLNCTVFRAMIAHFREGEDAGYKRWYTETLSPRLAGLRPRS